MTIYTFGDPDLLREALLALATIFSLVEWGDPGSAMGLGGNMLAPALIGLLAVAIAGITSQQVRLDYLLVALIVFGIGFSAKVDVNVEDMQTGDARVVADVPIGVAMVGAASSSAAASLTETISTAIQRPGVTTSSLTAGGFLNPLETLYVLRGLSFSELDDYVYKSLLEFYRMCIGNTLDSQPSRFNINAFRQSADPLAYILDSTNFLNFTTVYFTEANPDGTAESCISAAGLLTTAVSDLVSSSDQALAKIRMLRGAKYYNQPFDFADIDSAADIITRGTMTGQSFMQAALMRNFIADGEAWRLHDYGSNGAQYVADVTGALEEKRLADTIGGAVALNYMFPLMTFVQFLFFTFAPFVALIVLASPFTAARTLGMYMLLGVWAYSWLPIAAVINHYMQISLGSSIEFSDISAVGVEYSSLAAIDSFYDQIATKLSIGSAALAATPVIVGALLTASMSGIQSLAGKIMGGSNSNTSMGAPRLGEGRALVTAGGMGSMQEGVSMSSGGIGKVASLSQRFGYAQGGTQHAVQSGIQRSFESVKSAGMELESSQSYLKSTVDSAMQSGIVSSGSTANLSRDISRAIEKSFGGRVSFDDLRALSAEQRSVAEAHLGWDLGFVGMGDREYSGAGDTSVLQTIQSLNRSDSAKIGASFGEAFTETKSGQTQWGGELRDAFAETAKASMEYEQQKQAAERVQASAMSVNSITHGGQEYVVDMLQSAFSGNAPSDVIQSLRGDVSAYFGVEKGKQIFAEAERLHWNKGESIRGADGLNDRHMDYFDQGGALITAVANEAARDGNALPALFAMYQSLGRVSGTSMHHSTQGLAGADDDLASGLGLFDSVGSKTGTFESGPNKPAGSESVRKLASDRRAAALSQQSFTGKEREEAMRGFGADQQTVRSESAPGDLEGRVSAAETYVNAALSPKNSALKLLPEELLGWWRGEGGFENTASRLLPNALAAEPGSSEQGSAIQAALGGLTRELLTQNKEGAVHFDAKEVYESLISEHGFKPEDALIGTFASVGMSNPGGRDYFAAALTGLAGVKGMEKLGASLGRAGPWVAAATGFAGAALVSINSDVNRAEGLSNMKETYKSRFATMVGDETTVRQFSAAVDNASSMSELVSTVTPYLDDDPSNDKTLSQEEFLHLIAQNEPYKGMTKEERVLQFDGMDGF